MIAGEKAYQKEKKCQRINQVKAKGHKIGLHVKKSPGKI
jgi:hypothetical protein